jgi:lactoylglutathione lyase
MLSYNPIIRYIIRYKLRSILDATAGQDFPGGRITLAFVRYGPETDNTVVELARNWDPKAHYQIGSGFGHLALGMTDIHAVCAALAEQDVSIQKKPGPMKHGVARIAFIEDPGGDRIEPIGLDTEHGLHRRARLGRCHTCGGAAVTPGIHPVGARVAV